MAGFIIFEDGRAYSSSNWAYDLVVIEVTAVLQKQNTTESKILATWVAEQTSEVCGSGLGSVDMRTLTTENKTLFEKALREAYLAAKNKGPKDWPDPERFEGWLSRFEDAVKILDSIAKGEAPTFNPHMKGLIPSPKEKKKGPGWT